MSERFFSDRPIREGTFELGGDEARHLLTVMRAKVGDEATLFDGCGSEFLGRIASFGKHAVKFTIVERRAISRELPTSLTLAVALPKGERQKWLVEKATELGVSRLVPLLTERGVAEATPAALGRLRRGVVEASKQCGRNRLMEIAPPARAMEFFAAPSEAAMCLIADPSGQPLARQLSATAADILAAIGPEGGFTDGERAAAKTAGWQAVSLGPRILRVETAAIALAALVACGG